MESQYKYRKGQRVKVSGRIDGINFSGQKGTIVELIEIESSYDYIVEFDDNFDHHLYNPKNVVPSGKGYMVIEKYVSLAEIIYPGCLVTIKNGEKYLLLDNNSFINFETKEKRNFVIDRNKMLLDDMPIVSVFCETKSNNVFSYAGRTIIFKAEDN